MKEKQQIQVGSSAMNSMNQVQIDGFGSHFGKNKFDDLWGKVQTGYSIKISKFISFLIGKDEDNLN